MACIDAPAPLRDQKSCAKKAWIIRTWQAIKARWLARNHPKVPARNPHIARDIGLSAGQEARLNHQWPSQTNVHPRL